MDNDAYLTRAKQQLVDESRQASIDAVNARASQMREADGRAEQLAGLRERHGLPAHATARQVADAERAFAAAWPSFVSGRNTGVLGAKSVHLLDPDNSGFEDPAIIAKLHERRAELRAEFDASWPPRDLAERIMNNTVDSATQGQAHNATRAV